MANVEKKVPRDFITEDGFGITPEVPRYLQPLIEGEDYPPYKKACRIREDQGVAVKKKLKPRSSPETPSYHLRQPGPARLHARVPSRTALVYPAVSHVVIP